MRDPYQVLGISRGASDEEIKKAYRTQCKRWHPDLNPNDPTAEEHFKEVQEAYDAIVKGDAGTQSSPYGAQSGYGQSGYGGYAQNDYSQQSQWADDPFGFGSFFGGSYGYQQAGPSYATSESAEMQAARNFLASSRYAEARRVLDGISLRTARWYYYSALANSGLGSSIAALQDARRAYQMEPSNPEYRSLYSRLQTPGEGYRRRTVSYGTPGGLGRWCVTMVLLNLFCTFCFGGGCRGFYFGPGYYM